MTEVVVAAGADPLGGTVVDVVVVVDGGFGLVVVVTGLVVVVGGFTVVVVLVDVDELVDVVASGLA